MTMQRQKTRPVTIPIFPLPNVVFFPKTMLPLHIFELRYRQMVEDAWAGLRHIGMVLLKPGWERDYFGTPEVHPIGCVGEIQALERQQDGKFNIMLYGLSRFRISRFIQEAPYRVAQVRLLKDAPFDRDPRDADQEAADFLRLVRAYLQEMGVKETEELERLRQHSLEAIANQMISVLDFSTHEKQAFLEIGDLEMRLGRLRRLLERRLFEIRIVRRLKFVPEDPRLN